MSIFEKVSVLKLDLRDTVILIQAGIEYHVNQLMLKCFRTDSFESERINSKLKSLNDIGMIDDTLRQDLIQIARIKHLFAHQITVDGIEFSKLLKEINRKESSDTKDLCEIFLESVKQSYDLIKEKDDNLE